MANYKSSKKRILTTERERQRNIMVKSKVRTAVKKVHAALQLGEKGNLSELAQRAVIELDRAQTKGIMHRNNVARRKARLMQRVNEAQR